MRRYSELAKLKTFEERLAYLRIDGTIGEDTFGFDRYLNQIFYKSTEWKNARRAVIIRDNGFDLGVDGYDIPNGMLLVHHMNPIDKAMIVRRDPDIFNPEYLICVSKRTHNAIHFGGVLEHAVEPVVRTPNDTKLW